MKYKNCEDCGKRVYKILGMPIEELESEGLLFHAVNCGCKSLKEKEEKEETNMNKNVNIVKDYKVVVQDKRAKNKEFYKEPIDAREKDEMKYINIYIPMDHVLYIGTNDKQNTHEYFKNSQYMVIKAWDYDGFPFTFKVDMKYMRVENIGGSNTKFYINVDSEKDIRVYVQDEDGWKGEKDISYWALKLVLEKMTNLYNLDITSTNEAGEPCVKVDVRK